jgi:hypothetical protein
VLWESRGELEVGEDLMRWEEMRGEKGEEKRREERREGRREERREERGKEHGKTPFLGCSGRVGES